MEMRIKMRKNMAEIITENRTGQRTGICIIIGAGELTVDAIPVRPEDFVIAADGGYAHCRQLGEMCIRDRPDGQRPLSSHRAGFR